jgi:transposase-like protein
MKKNQKHTQEEMNKAIEHCHKEGLSYMQYCKQAGIHYHSFRYWVKKYQKEKGGSLNDVPGFLPIEVTASIPFVEPGHKTKELDIKYPNGIQVTCPVNVPAIVLKTLLKF